MARSDMDEKKTDNWSLLDLTSATPGIVLKTASD